VARLTDNTPPALEAGRDALFLDLDGTLVEIADDPAGVRMDEPARALLRALSARMDGAVALLTGRSLEAADIISGGAIEPVGALHGIDMRLSRAVLHTAPPLLQQMRTASAKFSALIASGALDARMEDKGASVALHYRHAPHAQQHVHALAHAFAAEHGLRTLKGKMVIELLPPGADKGQALRAFMQQAPFVNRRPIMVGDDVTDESAFDAANALGGRSVLVGAPRDTAALHALPGVAAVRAWLGRALETAP